MGKKKKEYTLADIEQDMERLGQLLPIIMERLETVEDKVESNGDDTSFGTEDKRGAAQMLVRNVVNPDPKMLPQMTETPDRLIVPLAVKYAQNEFIRLRMDDPGKIVFFSDILMSWFATLMRSRNRALIGELMGFAQIQVDHEAEQTRALELKE